MTDDTATFSIGFKNVLGARWTRFSDHPWHVREPRLRAELAGADGMGASVYFLVEVNGRTERRSLDAMLPGWDVVRSPRHDDVYSDPAAHRVVESHVHGLGSTTSQRRHVTIVRFEHLVSGVGWTAACTHLSSSVGTTVDRARASRAAEADRLVELCRRHDVDVIAADLNNNVLHPARPRGILAAAGYRDWRDLVDVEHVDLDTHHPIGSPHPATGRHIDTFHVGDRVEVLDGRLHVSPEPSSDHLGLVCTIRVRT